MGVDRSDSFTRPAGWEVLTENRRELRRLGLADQISVICQAVLLNYQM
jgi:hypothetical protein